MKKLKLYWSHSKPNFGDALSPMICERLSCRPVVYASKRKCELVAVGSLLNRFRESIFSRPIHIWGTGFIEEIRPRKGRFLYHAVRGKRSAELIRGKKINTYGDPGLLVDVLWPRLNKVRKSKRLGIVPHYKDRDKSEVKALANNSVSCAIIDVFDDVSHVLHQIAGCEVVLSSSLHGLIVADALGIPNARIKFSDNIRGRDFKFNDYYSIYGYEDKAIALNPCQIDGNTLGGVIENYNRPGIEPIKHRLIQAFPFPG